MTPWNWIDADPKGLFFGAKVKRGWTLVGRFRCRCGKHEHDPYVAVWKKGGSYVLQRSTGEGTYHEHLVHPLHSKYNPTDWQLEITAVWPDLMGHPIEREYMPRPKGVRYR